MNSFLSEKNKLKRLIIKSKKRIFEMANKLVAAKDVPLDLCLPMINETNNIMNLQVIINGLNSPVDEREILEKSFKKTKKG